MFNIFMKLKLVLVLAFIQIAIVSCNNEAKKSADSLITVDSKVLTDDSVSFEQKLQERIFELPLVKEKTAELRKLNPEIRLVTIVEGYPEEGSPYYQIEFAEMQDTHKTNIYWFYINQQSSEIFVQDTASGKLIPIETK